MLCSIQTEERQGYCLPFLRELGCKDEERLCHYLPLQLVLQEFDLFENRPKYRTIDLGSS